MDNRSDLLAVDLWGNGSFNATIASSPVSPMDKVINLTSIGFVLFLMVSVGCTMEVSKIKAHIMKPRGVGIAVVTQYGVMPLTAFCLAKTFQLTEMAAVVVLICGCCPGGTVSNILSLMVRGDMNLSITMTACSTVLALGMMPLLLFLYCQGFDLHEAVPYLDIIRSLVVTLIPCGIGILINHYRPRYSRAVMKAGLSISSVGMIVIGVLLALHTKTLILLIIAPTMLSIALLMPMMGFTLGYAISSLFRLTQAERRTVAMETGCQNGQLCLAIIRMAFPPAAVGTLYLFPLVYIFSQMSEALLIALIFRCHQYWAQRRPKERYLPPMTDNEEVTVPSEVPAPPELSATRLCV